MHTMVYEPGQPKRMEVTVASPFFAELAGALLRDAVSVQFRARGRSMEPSIRDGDLVTVAPLDGRPRRGDVLLAAAGNGRVLLHRCVGTRRGSDALVRLRGDATLHTTDTLPAESVLGRAVARRHGNRTTRLDTPACRLLGLARAGLRRLWWYARRG
jgi:hypothetical protein